MARELHILSAGAAKAVVLALQPDVEREEGIALNLTFGAVGTMRELWAGGAPCDVLILSARLLDELAGEGALLAHGRVSLGRVHTGIAVRAGSALPAIANAAQLKQSLLAAAALYLPDPQRATAGIHCVDVLRRLDIYATLQERLRPLPNGAVAMAALAADPTPGALGCTQVTEILYTPGVTLAGVLPPGFELNTEYGAAVVTRAREPEIAQRFVRRLGSDGSRAVRRDGGFEA